jgi:IS5 family transposase
MPEIETDPFLFRCFRDASIPSVAQQERSLPRAPGCDHQHAVPAGAIVGVDAVARFDEAFGRFYRPVGRPAKPTRLMVGLHYLKHVYDLSDEEVVERWVENAYWQFFCGFEFFQHEAPIDASTMTRWRKRIGPEGLEEMLKAVVNRAAISRSSSARLLYVRRRDQSCRS